MIGHLIAHLKLPIAEPIGNAISFFSGVPIFFALSGLLIWFSISNSVSVKQYFGKLTIFQFWTPDSLRDYGVGTPNGAFWVLFAMEYDTCIGIDWICLSVSKASHFNRYFIWFVFISYDCG